MSSERERRENDKHIRAFYGRKGKKVLVVDTKKVTWRGREPRSNYEKRKIENGLVMENFNQPIHVIFE